MPDFEKINGVAAASIEKIDGVSLSSIQSVVGLSTPATSTFLEDYPGAVAAYSLRKLSSTATSAIRVRNNSSTEADIGFDSNGDLDTASLLLHCGSNSGRIVTWYDQSGNSNHMTQSDQADMPYIVDNSGNLIVTSRQSIPTIDFYFGSDGKHLSDTFSSNNGDHFILSYVAEFESVTDAQQIVSQWTSSTSTQTLQASILGQTSSLRVAARYSDTLNSLGRADTAQVTVSTGTEYVVVGYISASPYTGDIDVNGDTATTLTGFPSTGNLRTASAGITIGRRHDSGAAQYRGYLSEVIIWSASTLPNRNNIMTDTKSHYGIT